VCDGEGVDDGLDSCPVHFGLESDSECQ
jgi:hypothetical protein